MSWSYLVASALILLALPGCAPIAPVSIPSPTVNSTVTPSPSVSPTPRSLTTPESPSAIPPSERVPRMTIEELLQNIQSNADIVIVDTRVDVEEQFHLGHIKGAIPVPLSKIMAGEWTTPIDKEIIFYCT